MPRGDAGNNRLACSIMQPSLPNSGGFMNCKVLTEICSHVLVYLIFVNLINNNRYNVVGAEQFACRHPL